MLNVPELFLFVTCINMYRRVYKEGKDEQTIYRYWRDLGVSGRT